MNPDAGPTAYACGDTDAAPKSLAAGEAAGRRRNATTHVAGRRFHSRDDLYSQPAFGDMFSNLTASFDPIFWPIHVNIDRLWWEWQARNPNSLPADLDSVLSPWSYTVRDMLDISRFGYEYVRCAFFMPVGLEAPIGRFVSKPIVIDETVKRFRKAEVRLHWVPQFMRSYMAVPWQTDFNECTDNPTDVTYALWNSIDPASGNDTRLANSRKIADTLWWPAHRPLQYTAAQVAQGDVSYQWLNWSRGIPQTSRGDLKMVTGWSGLPFIIRNPYLPQSIDQAAPSDLDNSPRYVSIEPVKGR
jgi:hypothetical protein